MQGSIQNNEECKEITERGENYDIDDPEKLKCKEISLKDREKNNLSVENLVAIELSYINTKHPDFHDAAFICSNKADVFDNRKIANKKTENISNPSAQYVTNLNVADSTTEKVVNKPSSIQRLSGLNANDPNMTSGWISNFMPASMGTKPEVNNKSESASSTPIHDKSLSPVKAVNLLPEVVSLCFCTFKKNTLRFPINLILIYFQ
ncbi:uncharacterized protein LOC111632415 [Centruroides sculpturatus]|uniref:uncharacterized protein LOC111632415 n=1 Tax=Centruroides sculpturatus TaxID=218467 RepID=UPI000C6E83CB|nr:uncharacterized protein LOC111632415 [Centruroides sculpturatus]